MNQELNKYISVKKPQLEKVIRSFLLQKSKELKMHNAVSIDAYKKLDDFSLQGKLLRGILLLLSYEMFSEKKSNTVYYASAALELIHSSLLIHDDFMDNDLVRRGKKSIFAQYTENKKAHNPLLYGQSMAVCLGDATFFISLELVLKSTNNKNILHKACGLFSDEINKVCMTQMLDVHYGQTLDEPTEKEILDIYLYKTARYTFSLPLMLGAILANQPQSIINHLETLGEKMGIIYQIKDDTLGIFGDAKTIGKPVGSDIRENKKTIIRKYLYTNVTDTEKQKLNKIFGNKNMSIENIEYVKELIQKYNILKTLEKKVHTMDTNVKTIITALPINKNYRDILTELQHFNINREK